MKNEWKDNKAGNGLNQYSNLDAATFPKSNPRKGSYASALCDKAIRTPNPSSLRWPPMSKNPRGGRCSFYTKASFQDDSSEGEFQRVDRGSPDPYSAMKIAANQENYSTASSFGGPKQDNYQSKQPIDNFKVVVLGDEFDGIKTKGLPNNRFAAACLFKPPEANELKLPDF